MPDWVAMDAVGIAASMRDAEISPLDLLEETLEVIGAIDPELNAVTQLDVEGARKQAMKASRRLETGGAGALLGVPITIKDAVWVKGLRATNGSLAYEHFVPTEDSAVVARLREAGAVIVGKTNNPEFLYRTFTDNRIFGPTRNPWDVTRTAGGSSGGSAAAVASGMGFLSIGSDSGGSVRVPASFCHIVGHKPTHDVVPAAPAFRAWPSLGDVGPMARSVRDVALAMQITARPGLWDASLPAVQQHLTLAGVKIAYSVDLGQALVDAEVKGIFLTAMAKMAGADAATTQVHAASPNLFDLWGRISGPECYAAQGPLLAQWREKMSAGTAAIIDAGQDMTAGDYLDALHERSLLQADWERFLSEFDVLITPTCEVPAYEVDKGAPRHINGMVAGDPDSEEWSRLALLANLTGQPALAVPIGLTSAGLPVGMQVMARQHRDDMCFAVGMAWEKLAEPVMVRPPLFGSASAG